MAEILIVEDEPDQAELIAFSLRKANYVTRIASNGQEALDSLAKQQPDLVVLDRLLPDIDGYELCKRISQDYRIPILILTACKTSDKDIVQALSIGAQDYVQKSHSHSELVARIKVILERNKSPVRNIRLKDVTLWLDLSKQRAFLGKEELLLTPTEWRLLLCLTKAPGITVSHKELMWDVWEQSFVDVDLIKVHISRLRQKLQNAGCREQVVRAVYGKGYCFGSLVRSAKQPEVVSSQRT
ncbi:MAG: response regulator transcription factor [Candidatus Melainabacteria bacterium]|nr:response regulator transcription factor [Candidatus Melainabacteria bacterium]